MISSFLLSKTSSTIDLSNFKTIFLPSNKEEIKRSFLPKVMLMKILWPSQPQGKKNIISKDLLRRRR